MARYDCMPYGTGNAIGLLSCTYGKYWTISQLKSFDCNRSVGAVLLCFVQNSRVSLKHLYWDDVALKWIARSVDDAPLHNTQCESVVPRFRSIWLRFWVIVGFTSRSSRRQWMKQWWLAVRLCRCCVILLFEDFYISQLLAKRKEEPMLLKDDNGSLSTLRQ